MTVAVGVGIGAVLAVVAWHAAREMFSAPVFQVTNFRGRVVPAGVGVLVAGVALAAEAGFTVADAAGHGPDAQGQRLVVLLGVVGFALLGLVDDLAAAGPDRGFAGHVRALAHGRLTTGAVKLVGGGLLAIVIAGTVDRGDGWRLLADACLVALCANLGNLFDRAPGRTTKVALLSFLGLVAATGAPRSLTGVGVVVGAGLGLLAFDLHEQLMLGDAGANAIGAALGIGLVVATGFGVRLAVLVVVAALNAVSERVSFSQVIDRVAALRFLDRLGRRP
jgi:UDP-N-acetylmuramyl pentapeptide phosphotransferase/UDP-N-acetylglucosamine-1-phosphate transferase